MGDTTSILLAKAAGLDFMDFFFVDGRPGMFWVTECGALLSALIILWFFRKEKQTQGEIYEISLKEAMQSAYSKESRAAHVRCLEECQEHKFSGVIAPRIAVLLPVYISKYAVYMGMRLHFPNSFSINRNEESVRIGISICVSSPYCTAAFRTQVCNILIPSPDVPGLRKNWHRQSRLSCSVKKAHAASSLLASKTA